MWNKCGFLAYLWASFSQPAQQHCEMWLNTHTLQSDSTKPRAGAQSCELRVPVSWGSLQCTQAAPDTSPAHLRWIPLPWTCRAAPALESAAASGPWEEAGRNVWQDWQRMGMTLHRVKSVKNNKNRAWVEQNCSRHPAERGRSLRLHTRAGASSSSVLPGNLLSQK